MYPAGRQISILKIGVLALFPEGQTPLYNCKGVPLFCCIVSIL
nr:MAG TPA: hypothetical protein [Caudoviricetes sp.]